MDGKRWTTRNEPWFLKHRVLEGAGFCGQDKKARYFMEMQIYEKDGPKHHTQKAKRGGANAKAYILLFRGLCVCDEVWCTAIQGSRADDQG